MGLVPDNVATIRQPAPPPGEAFNPDDIIIEGDADDQDMPELDDSGDVIKIEHADGSVTISLNGALNKPKRGGKDWYANLAEEIEHSELARIADDLLRGIDDDIRSRQEWIEDRANGIKLLGLKIEIPGVQGGSDGAPVEGMSKVRHPLLLEAVLRFQANARSEMLPTDGPVKIRNDENNNDINTDELSNSLERDLNHYLTVTATEYYPDTDRMLLMVGFGGSGFKKVYYCPLRNRPVSESVDVDDLIVNQSATDLANAKRITHRIYMRPSTLKRMQIIGAYRDIDLGSPKQHDIDALQREERAQQGIAPEAQSPNDRDHEIYECYCELDIKGYEHQWKGKDSGLEVPYRVTIDVSSREILSIVRNYPESKKELPDAKKAFVKYSFVPGFGFYDIGLLHILGNTTNAVTAAWREMLDNGMYANFPGFLMADTGGRQNTNIFRVPPGGGALVKTGGMPINQAIMPLPYQTQGMAALMSLTENMAETGMRIGGTSEQQVGEGRAEAPVGTTLAMIEQATKVMNAVHKRMHAAQAEEFQLLVDVFREYPESFWQRNRKPARQWDEQTFLKALDNCNLVPQADPNTSSHGQRVMKIMALKQLQAANPTMYDPIAIDTAAIRAIGWNNPQQFFAPPSAQQQPPPEMQKQMAELKVQQQKADATTMDAQTRKMEAEAKIQQGAHAPPQQGLAGGEPPPNEIDIMMARAKLMDSQTRHQEVSVKRENQDREDQNLDLDRVSREKMAALATAKDILLHHSDQDVVADAESIEKRMGIGKNEER